MSSRLRSTSQRRRIAVRQSGAAAVELALVLPLLLILVFGIVDFGRAYNAQISLTQAAREGARVRALGGDVPDTEARVEAAAMDVNNSPVAVDPGDACPNGADVAAVSASQDFTYLTPIGALAGLAIGPLTITGKAVMRCLG